MKVQANQFQQSNVKGCVEHASNMLMGIKDLGLSNDDAMALAKAQMLTSHENGDMLQSAAWALVHMEILERQIRVEDHQVEKAPPGWNGGFNDYFIPPATKAGAEPTYTVQFNESQRLRFVAGMSTLTRNDLNEKLMVDLTNLPEDAKYSTVVTFIDDKN